MKSTFQARLKMVVAALVALAGVLGGSACATEVGLPILLLVERDQSFRPSYAWNNSYRDSRGRTVGRSIDSKVDQLDREEVIEKLAGEIAGRLRKHDSGGILRPDLCDNAEEMFEKANSGKGYLCLRVTVKSRKEFDTDQGGCRLCIGFQLHRCTADGWKQMAVVNSCDTEFKADDEDAKRNADITMMADQLDQLVMKHVIMFKPVSAISPNLKSKAIRVQIQNPTPYDITMVKWIVPDSKKDLRATTEGKLGPGKEASIEIAVTSEGTHGAIQWRDIRISEITFTKPGE